MDKGPFGMAAIIDENSKTGKNKMSPPDGRPRWNAT